MLQLYLFHDIYLFVNATAYAISWVEYISTSCHTNLDNVPLKECFEVTVPSSSDDLSGIIQLDSQTCLGPGQILESTKNQLLLYNFNQIYQCDGVGNDTVTIKVRFYTCIVE